MLVKKIFNSIFTQLKEEAKNFRGIVVGLKFFLNITPVN